MTRKSKHEENIEKLNRKWVRKNSFRENEHRHPWKKAFKQGLGERLPDHDNTKDKE